jgi:hypothetical protein
MIVGPLFAATPAAPAAKTTPSGLVIPDLSWTAARFGLVPVRHGWLDNGTGAYLTAREYLAPFELAPAGTLARTFLARWIRHL